MPPATGPEIPYVPLNFDDSQTTKIIITADTTPVTVYYKHRDKFQFKVGAGLTIQKITFEALDSIAYYDVDS